MNDHNIASRYSVEPLQAKPNWWIIGVAVGCLAVWGAIIWGIVELANRAK